MWHTKPLPSCNERPNLSGVVSDLFFTGDFSLDAAFFAYSWKLPSCSGAFLLTIDNFCMFTYSWSFCAYSFSFFAYSWSFFAYSWSFCVSNKGLEGLQAKNLNCKQEAPTVSKKASPLN